MTTRAEAAPARLAARRALLSRFRADRRVEWVPLTGTSMRPLVEPGSSALVDFGARHPGIGAIALADRGDIIIAHRVVSVPRAGGPDRFLLQGDAEPFADRPMGADDIYGVVLAIRRPDGSVSRAGLSGGRARVLARTSRISGRALRLATRAIRHLPPRARHPIGRALRRAVRAPVFLVAITPRRGEPIAIPNGRR